jgi:hypothetical protein
MSSDLATHALHVTCIKVGFIITINWFALCMMPFNVLKIPAVPLHSTLAFSETAVSFFCTICSLCVSSVKIRKFHVFTYSKQNFVSCINFSAEANLYGFGNYYGFYFLSCCFMTVEPFWYFFYSFTSWTHHSVPLTLKGPLLSSVCFFM